MGFSLQTPVVGEDFSLAAPKVGSNFAALQTWGNGNIATTDLSTALAQSATVNQSGQTVKGAVSIAATESRTNVAYGTLTTPDQVTGIVLPANGQIIVLYQAMWQESVVGAARAAIFLNTNQLVASSIGGVPLVLAAGMGGAANPNLDMPLSSCSQGLGSGGGGTTSTSPDVTTGQVLGSNFAPQGAIGAGAVATLQGAAWGACYMFAAAGTYTVSVQFKATSGSVTAKNRTLRVLALSFA